MSLYTLLIAGAIAVSSGTASTIKNQNNNDYAPYLPNETITLKMFQADRDGAGSEYRFGLLLYWYSNTNYNTVYNIDDWELNIYVNDTLIYTCNDTITSLTINGAYGGILDTSIQSYLEDNTGTIRAFYHTCYFGDDAYLYIDDILEYTTSGRKDYSSSTNTTDFNIDVEMIANPILNGRNGSWAASLGTFKTYEAAAPNYSSQLDFVVYANNKMLDAVGISSFSILNNVIDSNDANNITYTSDNSNLRYRSGATDYINNDYSNYRTNNIIKYSEAVSGYNTFRASDGYNTFNINANEYFYQYCSVYYRTPTRCYVSKRLEQIAQKTYRLTILTIATQFTYISDIIGGTPIGGGAGSDDTTIPDLTIQCSGGGLLTDFACYINNALGSTLTQGPLFKPLMNVVNAINNFLDKTTGLLFQILDLLKGDIM